MTAEILTFRRPSEQLGTDNPPKPEVATCFKCNSGLFHIVTNGAAVCNGCGETHDLGHLVWPQCP